MAKNDNMEGGQMIAYFAIVVIAISLFVIGMRFTGYSVADTAVLNVTVDKVAAINFTTDFINFGNGSVNLGVASATLQSNIPNAVGGSWTYSAQHFTLENIGNVNVSLDLKTLNDAASFLGGTGPSYQYNVTNLETGSCGTPGITLGSWNDVNTTLDGTRICGAFNSASGSDTLQIDVKLVIPSDSNSGTAAFTDSFIATGTSA